MSGLYSNPSLRPCFQVDPREDQDFNCREEKAQVIGIGGMSEKKWKDQKKQLCTDFWEKSSFPG